MRNAGANGGGELGGDWDVCVCFCGLLCELCWYNVVVFVINFLPSVLFSYPSFLFHSFIHFLYIFFF